MWCLTGPSSHQCSRLLVLPVKSRVPMPLVRWRRRKQTQPVEAPGAVRATRPVEASMFLQRFKLLIRMVPTLLLLTEPRFSSQVLPAIPTPVVDPRFKVPLDSLLLLQPAEDPVSDTEHLSDHVSASHVDEEGEVSDMESADGSIGSRSRRSVRCGPRTEC